MFNFENLNMLLMYVHIVILLIYILFNYLYFQQCVTLCYLDNSANDHFIHYP